MLKTFITEPNVNTIYIELSINGYNATKTCTKSVNFQYLFWKLVLFFVFLIKYNFTLLL